MNTKAINTSGVDTSCDVCGRTLLRGERAESYVSGGGARRSVCDLCTSRAVQGGWIREGTVPAFDAGDARSERRRSLLSRLRGRRAPASVSPADAGGGASLNRTSPPVSSPATPLTSPGSPEAALGDARSDGSRSDGQRSDASRSDGQRSDGSRSDGRRSDGRWSPLGRLRSRRGAAAPPSPGSAYGDELDGQSGGEPAPAPVRARDPLREPRQVHAIPATHDHKIATAVGLFNACEHRRTVSGVARSLGPPTVAVLPSEVHPSMVELVVSWELCWYRYEVDLSEDQPHVRVCAQGYELDELSELERTANATADEGGGLTV